MDAGGRTDQETEPTGCFPDTFRGPADHQQHTEQNTGGALHLDSNIGTDAAPCSVHDALLAKHPPGQNVSTNALYSTTTEPATVHPVVFETIDATTIKTAALRSTDGAAGASGIDARVGDDYLHHFKLPQLICVTLWRYLLEDSALSSLI